MCGITGYVGPAPSGLLARMVAALEHRGPDASGIHEEPRAGIGTTRLAIIDVAGGRQPMTNEDGSLWLTFNGEIYNHRALRPALEAQGHRFRTGGDTEVVLHLFEEEGERCVERLRGMFAFAIWDARRRRLFVARDRLGKKPLYYWQRDGLFLFASEIKAILRHPEVSRSVDCDALHHYLAFGYTPSDRSIFSEVAKLPPGHTVVVEDRLLEPRPYWTLPPAGAVAGATMSVAEAAARVRQVLREAVRLRLESDVPLGVFLSGGIDSSALVACMREVTPGRIATFSIGFGTATPSYDELPYARLVAGRFETDHHEEILEPKIAELLPLLVQHFDEPFADSSAVPTFVVAQATARHLKVALSGVGGDETFAGYPRYLGLRVSEWWARLPRAARALPTAVALRVLRESEASRNWADWARRFAAGADRPLPDRYIGWTRFFGEAELLGLASPQLRGHWTGDVEARQRAAFATRGHGDPLDGAFRIDLASYLPDDLLTMADRIGMASSLEIRAPFCDHLLIEESLRIPPRTKLPGLSLKGLLKAAFADVLPREILSRRKQGFMIPLGRWLRTDLAHLVDDLLSPERVQARGLFAPAAVATLIEEHRRGRRSHGDRLWALVMLELWVQQYLDGGAPWRLS